jgi:predicted GIY-YIG superfamily endonuclease
MTQGIYCIECTVNGKKYYGSSMDVAARIRDHRRKLKGNRHDLHS